MVVPSDTIGTQALVAVAAARKPAKNTRNEDSIQDSTNKEYNNTIVRPLTLLVIIDTVHIDSASSPLPSTGSC